MGMPIFVVICICLGSIIYSSFLILPDIDNYITNEHVDEEIIHES